MDTVWLEDFLVLADVANFSRAAQRRHVTQPAFSRRIRLLEEWVGTPLVDRGTHQIALTPAGQQFRQDAEEILRRLKVGQGKGREAAQMAASTLRFASTHLLSFTFFPTWLRSLEAEANFGPVNLIADNMMACEQVMLRGNANFLLCHHHPSAFTKLHPQAFLSVTIGRDFLVPISKPDRKGQAIHALPGSESRPVSFLGYDETSGLGRILNCSRALDGPPAWLKPVFTSHLAILLKTMACDGRGIVWSSLSLVEEDLSRGQLVRAGDQSWDIPIEILLVRPRADQGHVAESFWTLVKARLPEAV
jgi:LysR family transcriptional regulator, hypochlorite-specific transcription factor HypT